MSVETVKYSEAYVSSWKRYVDSAFRIDHLSAADVENLRSDPETRRTIDSWRQKQAAAPTTSTRSRPTPAAKAVPVDEEQLANDLAAALKAEIDDAHSEELFKLFQTHHNASAISAALTASVCGVIIRHVSALQKRVVELEQRQYLGPWVGDRSYAKGAMTSRKGCVWHSNIANNRAKPGEAPFEAWTLAVKSGADGKAGKDGRDGKDAGPSHDA